MAGEEWRHELEARRREDPDEAESARELLPNGVVGIAEREHGALHGQHEYRHLREVGELHA